MSTIHSIMLLVLVAGSFFGYGKSPYLETRIDEIMKPVAAAGEWSGVLLMEKQGHTITRAFGYRDWNNKIPATPDTSFLLSRAGAPFTAIAIMKLVEQSKIGLNDPLSRFLPDYPAGDRITIHHLLCHSSGIPDWITFISEEKFNRIRSEPVSLDKILQMIQEQPLEFDPGAPLQQNRYPQPLITATANVFNLPNYMILDLVIEKASGMSFEKFIRQEILNPLGMNHTGFLKPDQTLPNLASCYVSRGDGPTMVSPVRWSDFIGFKTLYSTAGDLHKLFHSLKSDILLKRQSLEVMLHPYSGDTVGHRFCYGWAWAARPDLSNRIIYTSAEDDGLKVNMIYHIDENLTLIMLGNIGQLSPRQRPATTADTPRRQSRPYLQGLIRLLSAPPGESAAWHLEKIIDNKGLDAALDFYVQTSGSEKSRIYYRENEINALGYRLMNNGRLPEAVEILKINAELYPHSANAYDSLGEALMNQGKTDDAIKNYRKSLSLNPRNNNAREMLRKLEKPL